MRLASPFLGRGKRGGVRRKSVESANKPRGGGGTGRVKNGNWEKELNERQSKSTNYGGQISRGGRFVPRERATM